MPAIEQCSPHSGSDHLCPRLRVKGGRNLGGCSIGTLAGLLLGAVCVSLVTEAGVGTRQVLAACIPTGVQVCALIYICKQSQPGQGCTGPSGTAAVTTGDRGQEQPQDRRVENRRRKARCLHCGCQVMVGPGNTCCSPHTGYTVDFIAQGPQSKAGLLNLLLKCGAVSLGQGQGQEAQ